MAGTTHGGDLVTTHGVGAGATQDGVVGITLGTTVDIMDITLIGEGITDTILTIGEVTMGIVLIGVATMVIPDMVIMAILTIITEEMA